MKLQLFGWRWRLAARAGAVILVFSLCGCVASISGQKIAPIQVQQLHQRVTTREQVESIFGPPMRIDILDVNQRMLTYWYREVTIKAQSYFPILSLFGSGSDIRHQQLRVWIGTDNLVKDFQFTDVITDKTLTLGTLVTKRAPVPTQPSTGPPGPLIWYPGGEEGE